MPKSANPRVQIVDEQGDAATVTALGSLNVNVTGGEVTTASFFTMRFEYDANNNPIFVGDALPNTADDAEGWRIRKIQFDANGNPTIITWAGGSNLMTRVWDDRATYAYT